MVRIALVQQRATGDVDVNVARGLRAVAEAATGGANIVCFSELAFEPFYPQEVATGDVKELAHPVPGRLTEAFCRAAADNDVVIVLNLFERDGDATYDTSPIINRDGRILGKTRMVHITDYPCFHERGFYAPGDKGTPVFETDFGRIGVAICYDRHFPEYMRSLALRGADIVFVPQAGAVDEWPLGLFEAELRVAAFQNGYFTALCNRVGEETCLTFAGESFVCDPTGCVVARAEKLLDQILICDLDLGLVNASHARRLFLADRRPELYGEWLSRPAIPPSTPSTEVEIVL